MDGWKINLPFKLVPFQGCNAFPQACHRHLWVTPGMVSWHLGKVSFCIPCILQAASWSAEFTKTHERNHHNLELEELDILFFFEDLVFFFATTAHQYLDSTQQSLFLSNLHILLLHFSRVSCRNSDAGCTYQSSSKLQLPPGWLRGHLAIHSEVSQNFNERNCMNCQVVPGERKVRNLLLASPGIFVFQSWKLAEAFGWLCWHGTENRLLTMGHRFACESSSWDAFKQSFGERVGNPEAPPPRQANRSCPLRFLPFRHRQNVTGSDEFAGWEM